MSVRYKHHFQLPEIGEQGQEKLCQSKVLIVGLGGLGCPASLYLAAAGVGHIGLVDDDQVDFSNLQRQVLYSENDVGKPKVEVAKTKLQRLNSQVKVHAIAEKFSTENFEVLLEDYELVIDGTDNFISKYLINDACLASRLPVIVGAIDGFSGATALFEKNRGCYRCLFPEAPKSKKMNCSERGVIGALPGVIGSMQALLAIQWLVELDIPAQWNQFDFLKFQHKSFLFEKNQDCSVCNGRFGLAEVRAKNSSLIPRKLWIGLEQARNYSELRWIDVRSPQEFSSGHYQNAINWPLDSPEWDRLGSKVLIYCESGKRCQQIWSKVKNWSDVYFLEEGCRGL